jgi:RHS repeat-associated protein
MKLARVTLSLAALLVAVRANAQPPGLKHYKDPLLDPEVQRIMAAASREPVRPARWIRGPLAGHACSERRVDDQGRALRDKRVFSDGTIEETEYKPAGTLFRIVLHGPKGILEAARFCGASCRSRAGAQIIANGWPTPWAHEALMAGESERRGKASVQPARVRAGATMKSSTWDANGNLIADSDGNQYQYDFDDRLTKVVKADGSVIEHAYDADGNRVETRIIPANGPPQVTHFLVDPSGPLSQVVADTDASGTLEAHYVRGDDLLAVTRPLTPVPAGPGDWHTRYYHADGVGSVRALTNEVGVVTDSYTYTAFGERIDHTGTDPQPYAFAGEPWDPNSGFQYHRARWMDPKAGRFLGMDPHTGRSSDPSSLHKYTYAAGNPADRIDPTGRFFSAADVTSALATLSIIAAVAVPRLAAALNATAPLANVALRVVFWADVTVTTVSATGVAANHILDAMTSRLEAADSGGLVYPPGNKPRGYEIGHVAGQNLSDTFPIIDDFDFENGVATSIKSTTQVQSRGQLVDIIAGYAGEFDLIDDDLSGLDNNGARVVVPVNSIRSKNLLMVVPRLQPAVSRGLAADLARVARVMQVNIKLVQVRGLRGP